MLTPDQPAVGSFSFTTDVEGHADNIVPLVGAGGYFFGSAQDTNGGTVLVAEGGAGDSTGVGRLNDSQPVIVDITPGSTTLQFYNLAPRTTYTIDLYEADAPDHLHTHLFREYYPDGYYRWNSASDDTAAPTVIFYEFNDDPARSANFQGAAVEDFHSFTAAQRADTRAHFEFLAQELGITLIEVSPSDAIDANILIHGNTNIPGAIGFANYARPNGSTAGLTIEMDETTDISAERLYVLTHELGHALGLRHPFEDRPPVGPLADPLYDNHYFTAMSYTRSTHYQAGESFGELDLLALNAHYGDNQYLVDNRLSYTVVDGPSGLSMTIDQLGSTGAAFAGTSASDVIRAHGGNDTIWTSAGNDTVYAGTGHDTVYVESGQSLIYGQSGNDTIRLANSVTDAGTRLHGGAGDDAFHLAAKGGFDLGVLGGAGNDTVYLTTFRGGFIDGGSDYDTLSFAEKDSAPIRFFLHVIDSGLIINFEAFEGTEFDDTLSIENTASLGTDGFDVFAGLGNDTILGSEGRDLLEGDGGADTIRAGNDADIVSGGSGVDTLFGDGGADTIYGNSGSDGIEGGDGKDWISGGGGADTLGGDGGRDTLFGNAGNDVLVGGWGSDALNGGTANDDLHGGAGDDTLNGAAGNDKLSGDAGADIFEFRANHGFDRILDFEDGTDRISLKIGAITDIAQLTLTDIFSSVEVDYGSGTIRIRDISASDLTNDDFIFA